MTTSPVGVLCQFNGLVAGFAKWMDRAFNPQIPSTETTVLILRMSGGMWTFSVFPHTCNVDHSNSQFQGGGNRAIHLDCDSIRLRKFRVTFTFKVLHFSELLLVLKFSLSAHASEVV